MSEKDISKKKIVVTVSRTYNTGNYESLKLGATKEYYEHEATIQEAFDELVAEIEEAAIKHVVVHDPWSSSNRGGRWA